MVPSQSTCLLSPHANFLRTIPNKRHSIYDKKGKLKSLLFFVVPLAMPKAKTPEERFRKRARIALMDGRDYLARGKSNKRILEEVREEVRKEGKRMRVNEEDIKDDAVQAAVQAEDIVQTEDEDTVQAEDDAQFAQLAIEDDALTEVQVAKLAREAVSHVVKTAIHEAWVARMLPIWLKEHEEEQRRWKEEREEKLRQKEAAAALSALGFLGNETSLAERCLAVIHLQCEELKQRDRAQHRAQNTEQCIISGYCCKTHGKFCTSVMPEQTYSNFGWYGPQPGPQQKYDKAEQAAKKVMKNVWAKARKNVA